MLKFTALGNSYGGVHSKKGDIAAELPYYTIIPDVICDEYSPEDID